MAKVKVNSEFTAPCETSILYPANGGNMHCFTAVTACAVLDVLGPPYSDPEGRHCTYYRDLPFTSFSGFHPETISSPPSSYYLYPLDSFHNYRQLLSKNNKLPCENAVDGALSVPEEEREDYAWLQEREIPEDFTVVRAPYRGPIITTDN